MINIFLLVIKDTYKVVSRRLYWLYRLSSSKLGSQTNIEFPVTREGKGKLEIGNNSFIGRYSELGIGEKGNLLFGSGTCLERHCLIWIRKNCRLETGNGFKLGSRSRLFVQNEWSFGRDVKIETNCSIFSREPDLFGKLTIGDGTHVGDYTIMDVSDNITLGKQVAIGPNCTFYTHDHTYSNPDLPVWKGGVYTKPILIEDGAWIGSNVTILPGVQIGKRAVIAAGSVVTKSVNSATLVGGVPARIFKEI